MASKWILEALKRYVCQYTGDDEGNGLSLVDALTPNGDKDNTRGLLELELLSDAIDDDSLEISKKQEGSYRSEWHGMVYVCPRCYEEIMGTVAFCPTCGTRIEWVEKE